MEIISSQWEKIFASGHPETREFPGRWRECSMLERLAVLRVLRRDRVRAAALTLVEDELGQEFAEPGIFDLRTAYRDTTATSPLLFLLAHGEDPVAEILELASQLQMRQKLETLSLGQGQGPRAQRKIEEAVTRGYWVLLCNVHLGGAAWL